MGIILSVNVDGEEIIPDLRCNIVPHKKEIEESETAWNKVLKRRKEEREEMDKKREEYYEKHLKEETERINKLVNWHKYKLNEINEASADRRPKMLRGVYKCGQRDKHLGITITSFDAFDEINLPKYPPELEYPEYKEIEDNNEIYYDAPTRYTLPAGYKLYDYKKYFNQTIKTYQGHLEVKESLFNSIRGLLGPKTNGKKYTVNEVKDTISTFKFKKDLVNSIVRKLNNDSGYKSLIKVQKSCLFRYYENFRVKSYSVLGKHVKYKSNVLFHLLRLVGCNPNPDDFLLNGRASNERIETEIETVFKAMGWNYKPM